MCEDDLSGVFITVKRYNVAEKRIENIGDLVVKRSMTFKDFQEMLHEKHVPDIPADKMVVVQEIHRDLFYFMTPLSSTFAQLSVTDGDLLHVEPLSEGHYSTTTGTLCHSLVQTHYTQKMEEIMISVEESDRSLERRMRYAAEGDKVEKVMTHISCRRSDSLGSFRQLLSEQIGVPVNHMRLAIASNERMYRDLKVLKGDKKKLSSLLLKMQGSYDIFTDLSLEILDTAEELTEVHRIFNMKVYDIHGLLRDETDVVMTDTQTIGDMKRILQDKTGVPIERQVIGEWFDGHVFKLFTDDSATVLTEHLMESDQLRMDEIIDPALNVSGYPYPMECPNVALQCCQFVGWQQRSFSRTAGTTIPSLLVVPRAATVRDLRELLSERTGIPVDKLSLAIAFSFPAYESELKYMSDTIETKSSQLNAVSTTTQMTQGVSSVGETGANQRPQTVTSMDAADHVVPMTTFQGEGGLDYSSDDSTNAQYGDLEQWIHSDDDIMRNEPQTPSSTLTPANTPAGTPSITPANTPVDTSTAAAGSATGASRTPAHRRLFDENKGDATDAKLVTAVVSSEPPQLATLQHYRVRELALICIFDDRPQTATVAPVVSAAPKEATLRIKN